MRLAQFQHTINISTGFRYNGSKTVGGVRNSKVLHGVFCIQTDTRIHGLADSSIPPKIVVLQRGLFIISPLPNDQLLDHSNLIALTRKKIRSQKINVSEKKTRNL